MRDSLTRNGRSFAVAAALTLAAVAAVTPPALASAASPGTARSAESPDIFGGTGTLCNYNECLAAEGIQNGTPVKFLESGLGYSIWNVIQGHGTVTNDWPFTPGLGLNVKYLGHTVIQLAQAGDSMDLGVDPSGFTYAELRPSTFGNLLVEYSLGGQNYQLIDVAASDYWGTQGTGNVGYCFTNLGLNMQAGAFPCGYAGQTLTWTVQRTG